MVQTFKQIAMAGITYTEALTMPDDILSAYLTEYVEAQKRPWRIAQWVIMWMAAFHRAFKQPKRYEFFDPFKGSASGDKMSKAERQALFDKWDNLKQTGTKKKVQQWQ